jgi:hypothetical protein
VRSLSVNCLRSLSCLSGKIAIVKLAYLEIQLIQSTCKFLYSGDRPIINKV